MISATTPIILRSFLEGALPGPGSNNAVDVGELAFTTDTGRLVIGPSLARGNPNNSRTVFPLNNVEVLTEFSPRNAEVFQLSLRNQDVFDFYVPATVKANSGWSPLLVQDHDGGIAQNILPSGINLSAALEYHIIEGSTPIKSGVLRVLGSDGDPSIKDQSNSNTVAFRADYDAINGYTLSINNSLSNSVVVYLKQTAITTDGPISEYTSPTWVTRTGSLGSFANGTTISLQLTATGHNHLPITYFISSGFIGNGLSLSGSGHIDGNIANSSTFSVRATDGVSYSDQNFSLTVH